MESNVFIGTSGWMYKHWRNIVYPEKLPASKWLSYISSTFQVTEVNTSFYRLPSEETVLKWYRETPENFLFCPKMSRFLTHMKKLRDPEEPLERFFSVFGLIKDRLGPILIQLPHMVKFNFDLVEHFYEVLQREYSDYRFVMEVRHESWMEEKSLTLMTKYNIGFVIAHSNGCFPFSEMVTAEDIYIRFHGPEELYASSYPVKLLNQFARKIRKWGNEGHRIWAFFNNDIHGYAVPDAKKLIEMVAPKRKVF